MFELIGLLAVTALFFAFSFAVGAVYGRVAGLILRSQERNRRLRTIAVYLPPAFAAYMLTCAITFSIVVPGQSEALFFEGILEQLPNGYSPMALGKMPQNGWIEAPSTKTNQSAVHDHFGSLAVDGPLVFGAYNWRPGGMHIGDPGGGDPGYFSFDTRSGKSVDFATFR